MKIKNDSVIAPTQLLIIWAIGVMHILNKLAKHNIPAELSTKGLRKDGRCYPAPILLQKMLVLNIPVIISDDAHRCDELCRNFSDAEKLLHNLGYKNRWKLNKF